MARRAEGAREGVFEPEPGLFDGLASAADPAPEPAAPPAPPLFTVGELTAEIAERVGGLGRVRVEGELSGCKRAASGHLYFDLKDESARVSCVIWRSVVARALAFEPEEGAHVVAHGRLDVYPPRGSYSLIVDRLEPLGIGALLVQLEALKRELAALGWFARKRPLPALPRRIGVVTSRDGAALRDLLRTRSLRWRGFPLRLCHTPVQGPGAALAIADAVRALDASGVDVIVLCRGGGSLEDLWAFNERAVAEAIWRASVPVVTGVGHESDTTLADLVADHRAHTPTDAAQTVIPDRAALRAELVRWGNFLIEAMDGLVARRAERLGALARRPCLRSAAWVLSQRERGLRTSHARLALSARALIQRREGALQRLLTRLERQSPRARVARLSRRLERAGARLGEESRRTLERARERVGLAARGLEATSPLAVLGRGYSLTRRRGGDAPLRDASDVAVGEELDTRLARGRVVSRVVETEGGSAERR